MLRVFLAYALSGFVALGYQVAWFRIFADRFGSTNLTFALVVCSFIGGLGAGALASKPVTRWFARTLQLTDTLRLYGLIELLISAAALLTIFAAWVPADLWGSFPYFLNDGIWMQNLTYQVSQVAIGTACVFIPCFFMGVTFPLLCDAFVAAPGGARFPAALYAWNTLGACLGVLACQFVLLVWVGHGTTYWLMLGLNTGIGIYFLATGGAPADRDPTALPEAPHLPALESAPQKSATTTPNIAVLLTCAALSGLLAGALEGDMFKRLAFVLASGPGALMPAISFWAILAIFLASTLVHRWPRLGLTPIKIGFVLAGLYYFGAAQFIYRVLQAQQATSPDPVVMALSSLTGMFPTSSLQLFLLVGALVFVPYLLISTLLPWVCNHLQADRQHLGLAYGLNTAAFCLGLIGFTLVAPLVNIFYSLKLMGVLMLCGVGLLLLISERRRLALWQPALAAAGLLAGILLVPATFDPAYLAPGSPPARYPVSYLKSNGANTTFVVHQPGDTRLFFGNLSMSGTDARAQTYMRLMAHFPLLAQEKPAKALLICFGVGNTASAIAAHETIRQLDVVDLNEKVFATAPAFQAANFAVYADPRVRLIHDDGRSFLRRTTETYDLITSEPPPPMAAGTYRLYSAEYYRDALAHLTPAGMMTQWLPVYQMPAEAVRLAAATFVAVFPYSLLYVGHGNELILLGSRAPLDLQRIVRRFGESGRVRADLARIAVHQPLDLLARILRTDARLRQDFAGARLISDQHNELDHLYLAPERLAYLPYDPREVLSVVAAQSPAVAGLLEPVLTHLGRLRHHVEGFPLYAVAPDPGIRLSEVDWRRSAGLQWQSEVLTTQGDTGRARQALEAVLALAPEQPAILLRVARLLIGAGQNGPAQDYLRAFQQIEPDDPTGFASLGDALQGAGEAGLALAQYERAGLLAPDWWVPLNSLAWILAAHPDPAQRRPAAAIRAAARAVELSGARDPSALDTLATAYAAAGRFDDALTTGRQALALAEAEAEGLEPLAQPLAQPLSEGIREHLRSFAAGQIVVDARLATQPPTGDPAPAMATQQDGP